MDKAYYDKWNKLSGDQEWIRADFSIQVLTNEDNEEERIKLLIMDSFSEISEIQPLNDKAIQNQLKDRKGNFKNNQKKYDLISELEISLSNKQATIALDKWIEKLDYDFNSLKGISNEAN